jgi:N-acetylmuramoyl-L-alanine amidase
MEPILRGSTGPEVEDVQRRLHDLGLLAAAVLEDERGVYGPRTEDAVRGLQQQRGLPADGVVDSETWQVLVAASFRLGDRMLFHTRPMLRGDDVRDLQLRLSRLGFDAGIDDGVFGRSTRAALEAFQSEAGLDVDGILGPSTVDQLVRLHRAHHEAPAFVARERAELRRASRGSLVGARILLDPANGPDVPGWESPTGVREHEITWTVMAAVEGRLAALGAQVLLSRGPATSPSALERATLANESDVELIVSFGLNGARSRAARGATASYFGAREYVSERGRRLADVLLTRVVDVVGGPDCRSHPSTVSILRLSRAPAAVIEPGFLTNREDADRLTDPTVQRRLSEVIVEGIASFLTERQA